MSQALQPVAWVTGAGTPWGQAVALALAGCGYDLALQDRTPLRVDQTSEQVRSLGRTTRVYITETGKGLPTRAFAEEALEDFHRVDVLVNAVWAAPPSSLLSLDEWDWQQTLEINLSGPLLLMQAAAAVQRQQAGGAIFNLIPAYPNQASPPALQVTAEALFALSQAAAAEFLAYNIAVHAIRLSTPAPTGSAAPEISQILERLPKVSER